MTGETKDASTELQNMLGHISQLLPKASHPWALSSDVIELTKFKTKMNELEEIALSVNEELKRINEILLAQKLYLTYVNQY